jgi:hypothetical protein
MEELLNNYISESENVKHDMSEKISQVNELNNKKNEEAITNIQNQLKKYKHDTFSIMNECKELKSEKLKIVEELERTKSTLKNCKGKHEHEL